MPKKTFFYNIYLDIGTLVQAWCVGAISRPKLKTKMALYFHSDIERYIRSDSFIIDLIMLTYLIYILRLILNISLSIFYIMLTLDDEFMIFQLCEYWNKEMRKKRILEYLSKQTKNNKF